MVPGAWTQVRELDDGSADVTLEVAEQEAATALDVVQQWAHEQHISSVSVRIGVDERVIEDRPQPS